MLLSKMSDVRCQMSDVRCQMSDSDVRCQMSDVRCQISDFSWKRSLGAQASRLLRLRHAIALERSDLTTDI
jgi:hypothetical protein